MLEYLVLLCEQLPSTHSNKNKILIKKSVLTDVKYLLEFKIDYKILNTFHSFDL